MPLNYVMHLNERRAVAADRFLYAHKRDDTLARLGRHYRDHKAGMIVGGPGEFAEVTVRRK